MLPLCNMLQMCASVHRLMSVSVCVAYFELRVACCTLHMCALDNDGQYWHKKIIWGQRDGGAGARPRPLGASPSFSNTVAHY